VSDCIVVSKSEAEQVSKDPREFVIVLLAEKDKEDLKFSGLEIKKEGVMEASTADEFMRISFSINEPFVLKILSTTNPKIAFLADQESLDATAPFKQTSANIRKESKDSRFGETRSFNPFSLSNHSSQCITTRLTKSLA
jgi:hypothetical protein